jgi:hypothetical protein
LKFQNTESWSGTGDVCVIEKSSENSARFGFSPDGSVKSGVVEPVIVASVTGMASLPMPMFLLTPPNVNVAVPPPDEIVTAFVPDPLQATNAPQLKQAVGPGGGQLLRDDSTNSR